METFYNSRIDFCDENIRKYNRRINKYSFGRLLTIAAGFILIYQALAAESLFLTFAVFLSTVLVFVWLVRQHSIQYARREYFQNLRTVNQNEIDNIRSGSNLYSDGQQWNDENHPYSSDLDIFGPGSLYQLVNRSATAGGNSKLAEWFSAAADIPTIIARQDAIRELSAKKELTQSIQAQLYIHKDKDTEGIRRLYAYLEMPPLFGGHRWLQRYVAAAPFIFVATVALSVFFDGFQLLLLAIGLLNGGLIFFNMARINKTDRLISRAGAILGSFAGVFTEIENERWQSGYCLNLQGSIAAGGHRLSAKIKELSALIDKLDYRLNVFVSIILNYVFVWDLKQVFAIEAWKEKNKHDLRTAFDVIAHFEALIGLTTLHSNNPGWCFPDVVAPDNYTIAVRQMAHPLIAGPSRVANDFTLVNDRRIEIITGSNMAGKSTFLRTVGINAVLAFAGAPVCAVSFEISLMKLVSYMRIKDSLNESTSTFKAELNRLQMILQTAESEDKAYFLIDEMLRGTNSVDKYRGSKAVIEKLIAARAAGMVATHDLQLSKLEEEYPDNVRNFHFDIHVDGSEMMFDYKLRKGECTTFNASLLLRRIGVDV